MATPIFLGRLCARRARTLSTGTAELDLHWLRVTGSLIVPLGDLSGRAGWFYGPVRKKSARRAQSTLHIRASDQRPAGHRSSIAFRISSAHRTASAIALTVAGTLFPPSNWASLRAARILAAIKSTRLRPSSTPGVYHFSLFVRHGEVGVCAGATCGFYL